MVACRPCPVACCAITFDRAELGLSARTVNPMPAIWRAHPWPDDRKASRSRRPGRRTALVALAAVAVPAASLTPFSPRPGAAAPPPAMGGPRPGLPRSPTRKRGGAACAPGCARATMWDGSPAQPYPWAPASHPLPLAGTPLPATLTDPQLRGGFRYLTLFLSSP